MTATHPSQKFNGSAFWRQFKARSWRIAVVATASSPVQEPAVPDDWVEW